MAMVNWTVKYSVNIDSIDEQHKKFFTLMDSVLTVAHEIFVLKKDMDKVKPHLHDTLNELVNYSEYHFDYEQELFEKYGYPEAAEHRAEHEKIKESILNKLKAFISGESVDIRELIDFLVNWLQNHISSSDMKFSEFFISKGVK